MPIHRPDSLPILLFLFALIAGLLSMAPRQVHALLVDLPHPVEMGHVGILSPAYDRITVDREGAVRWNGEPVETAMLDRLLANAGREPLQRSLLLEADATASYADVIAVLAQIDRAGLNDHCFRFANIARFRTFEQPESFERLAPGESNECRPILGY